MKLEFDEKVFLGAVLIHLFAIAFALIAIFVYFPN